MMLLLVVILFSSPVFVEPTFFDLNNILNNTLNFVSYDPRKPFEVFPGYGKDWMFFPNGLGIPTIAYLNVTNVKPRLYYPINENVEFHLYTRANPNDSQLIHPNNKILLISDTNFDSNKPTKIITHGWTSSHMSDSCQTVKNNFLDYADCNVILVNWEKIASNILYPIAAMDTKEVGNYVGSMVDFLIDNGAKLEDIHMVGHSLGAHVIGNAGEAVKSGRVNRITGLDPALPGFEIISPNNKKLDPSDANFVDVIHTCGGILGYYSPLGHADFYPNGGIPSQPGCFGLTQIIESCSHGRAWQYFIESFRNKRNFVSIKCDTWDKFVNGDCFNNTVTPMGVSTPVTARGIYYLTTENKSQPPGNFDFSKIVNDTTNGVTNNLKKLVPFNL